MLGKFMMICYESQYFCFRLCRYSFPTISCSRHQVIKPIVAARPNLVDTSTLASHGNLYGRPIILAARDIEIATSIFAARKSQAVTPIVAARAVRFTSNAE
jgi:hypothetical protein